MSENQIVKGLDEKFCETCGSVIKKQAEICPKCGVRQKSSVLSMNSCYFRTIFGVLVSILLLSVLIVPLMSIPNTATYNMMDLSKDGVESLTYEVAILAISGTVVSILNSTKIFGRRRNLGPVIGINGIMTAVDLVYNMITVKEKINELYVKFIHYEWGWFYWGFIAILLIIVGFVKMPGKSDMEEAVE